LIEYLSSRDFSEHLQKTLLTTLDNRVDLALLDDRKLALRLEREARSFKSREELLGIYIDIVPGILLLASFDEVALLYPDGLISHS